MHKKGCILPAYFYSFLLLIFLFYSIRFLLFGHVNGFLHRLITCYEWHFKCLAFFYCLPVTCISDSSYFIRYFSHFLAPLFKGEGGGYRPLIHVYRLLFVTAQSFNEKYAFFLFTVLTTFSSAMSFRIKEEIF